MPLAEDDMVKAFRRIEPISRSVCPFWGYEEARLAGHECPRHEAAGENFAARHE